MLPTVFLLSTASGIFLVSSYPWGVRLALGSSLLALAAVWRVLDRAKAQSREFKLNLQEALRLRHGVLDEESLIARAREGVFQTDAQDVQHSDDLSVVRLLLEDSPSGILILSADQQVQHFNSKIARWFKRDFEKGGYHTLKEWFRDPRIEAAFDLALKSLAPSREVFELVIPGKTEVVHPFEFLFHPISGSATRMAILVTDRHESQKGAWQSEWVAHFSHEVRTPLTAIQGYTDLLLGDLRKMGLQPGASVSPQWNEDAVSQLQIIRRNTERLLDLSQDLLELSSLEAQQNAAPLRPALFREWVDAGQITHQVGQTLQPLLDKKQMKLRVENTEDLHPVDADPFRLEQVLLNLIENAIKYSRVESEIQVRWKNLGEKEVVLEVLDQGEGIPRETLPWVFERFYRADRSRGRSTGGAGLGLAIVRQIAEMHGGRVEAESSPEKGSVFRVYWPAALDSQG